MTDELLSARLQREGALGLEEVLRIVPRICDALAGLTQAGIRSTVTLSSVRLLENEPHLSPVPFPGEPRDLVRDVAALTFELLKGGPPPGQPSSSDFVGLRPELVKLLHAALLGTGAREPGDFARHLRSLGTGNTAHYLGPAAHDTLPARAPLPGATGPRVGQIFGAYELVRRLGEGGMGEVYVGRHVRLGREVAIKVLRDELSAMPDLVERFFQEAKLVNDLKHPNTVEILDFVEEPGRVYLVMELLDGRTLAELDRAEGPLPLARSCALLAQAASALAAAHARGIVHRDIKPENLFVLPDGRLKVLDFGVARRLNGSTQTQVGLVLGTPSYMAPEQAAGRPVDGRADLYALGVTLYELLTRTSMSEVTTPQPLARAASGEPIPGSLSGLVTALLSLDPAGRPSTAQEVQVVLEALAVVAPAPRALTKRHRVFASVSLLVAVGAAAWLLARPGREVPAPQRAIAPAAPPQVATTQAPLPPAPEPTPAVLPAAEPPRERPAPTRPRAAPAAPAPPVTEKLPDPPRDAMADFRPRLADVKRRFDRLVATYGAAQLTTLERAAVAETLAAGASGEHAGLDESLRSAEQALTEAERRLGH